LLTTCIQWSDCTFLTTKLVGAKVHLKSHSNEFKSNIMKLDKIFEKLNKKQRNIVALKRKPLKENVEI
jgi:ferritin-like metal-binding protein YciE